LQLVLLLLLLLLLLPALRLLPPRSGPAPPHRQ
jgi:hypothetical protein